MTTAVRWALVVGVALRLAFGLAYWTGKPLTNDEREYIALAVNLAQGRGLSPEPPWEAGPPVSSVQRFGRAPGYPVFLAPLTWLDADLRAGRLPAQVPAAVKIAQSLVGGLGIALLAAIVRRTAGERAGATAAWLAALFPPLIWMPAYALSEALYSAIALLCVWWLGALTDPPSPRLRRASPDPPRLRRASAASGR